MSREEIQKLLGGYATDTLSEAERRALFEAAIEDQELFDALAKEQALRDVLHDPSARQQLIEVLGPAREPVAARAWRWLRQPAALAMAGGMAALLIVAGLVLRQTRHPARREVMMADALVPPPPRAAEPSIVPPRAAQQKLFRAPAARVLRPSATLPAPPALPASRPAASPLPPAGALGSGALADTAEARRQMLQATRAPDLSFTARSGAPVASLSRAKAAPSVAVQLAVEYSLLLKDADGAYAPVPSSTVFHAGDSVRLQVAPSEAGYIYLFQHDATAGWNLVTSQRVEKAQLYVLPSTGGLRSDVPARLELLLVLSRLEQPTFATPQTADVDALASKAQAAFRIMIEYR
jgi:hypothetical protein